MTSAWPHNVSELPFSTLVSFHCLLHAAEAARLRWCDVQLLDVFMAARYEKVSGIVDISNMASHATQQCVRLDCLDVRQMITTMNPQFRITNLAKQFWTFQQDHRKSRSQPLQAPRCNGRGVHSVLRSGVEQQNFAHTVLLLGALPLPL